MGRILSLSQPMGRAKYPEAWDGLVGLWGMLEGGGDTAHDISGEGNDGTIDGPDWTPGGLSFVSGNSDYVLLPNFPVTDATITVKLKTSTAGQNGRIYGGWTEGRIGIEADNKVWAYANDGGWQATGTNNVVNDGIWHTLSFVMEQGVGIRLYIDGVFLGSDTLGNIAADVFGHRLGRQAQAAAGYATFELEFCARHHRVLTPNQISLIHALDLAYWLERRMAGIYSAPAAVGTILPHMMQLCT